MRLWLITYLVTAMGFLGCDAVWLSIPLGAGRHAAENFAVARARAAGIWYGATWCGALLGLMAYATYDLTNQATLRHWPLAITLADLCWGTRFTELAATIGFIAARWLGGSAATG